MFTILHKNHRHLSGDAMLDMEQADYEEANPESGSTFYEPTWDITISPRYTGDSMYAHNEQTHKSHV